MDFEIRYESMGDGTFLAAAHVEGEGSVFLGYVGKDYVFADEEVREVVEDTIRDRRARREGAAAQVEDIDAAALWEALVG